MTDTQPQATDPKPAPVTREVPRARLHLIAEIPAEAMPVFRIERTWDDCGAILRVYIEKAA
jgi:hypothetical protein